MSGYFYGHNDLELENTLYFFTSGRYEYKNKGFDVFIESLARLNHKLKKSGSKTTVVAFIIIPADTSSPAVEALKGQAIIRSFRGSLDEKHLINGQNRIPIRDRLSAMERNNLPPIVTYNMVNDADDPVLNQLRRVQLFNYPTDRVKVIFHPKFIKSPCPILPFEYDDFVRGMNLSIFPSYYEP